MRRVHTERPEFTITEEVIDWIDTAARLEMRNQFSLRSRLSWEDVAQSAIERLLCTRYPIRTRHGARLLIKQVVIDEFRTSKVAQRVERDWKPVSRELPPPPEDRSSISIQAYVMECHALGASPKEIAHELGYKSGSHVYFRIRQAESYSTRLKQLAIDIILTPEQEAARKARARGWPIV
jgi:hypothetical protein